MSKYFLLFLLSFSVLAQTTQKPLIEGKQGMVVSTHPAASEIGLAILKKGGNAIDAAVAVNFALAVCHPSAGNIGGGGFLVYRDKSGNVKALDYREKAPAAASRDMYLDAEGNIIPGKSMTGIFSVGVPGTVAGMQEMHDKLGKLPWVDLLQPAVDLARKGLILTEKEARGLNRQRSEFLKENPGKNYLLSADGKEWKAGDLLVQEDLANTLDLILKKKAKGFYEGPTARNIVKEMKAQNGIISKKDLRNYQAVWRTPVKSQYKNYQIIGMPPPSSGG